jgi:hypothetical protein
MRSAVNPFYISHSKSDWVNHQVLYEYLTLLRRNREQGTITLMMDQYPAHLSSPGLAKAEELDIQ